ncbi:MAG: UDP-N-acetylglucosamine 1-carboxyvinyltransferase [Clostridia bacterium]|nr:UDP-N-acetylglucosamine 1-carboxyvinyltransferase [Clostridia bacterium]
MEKILIRGGKPLYGTIEIDGMKNAALPIVFAALLVPGKCHIDNLPAVKDIALSLKILETLGARVEMLGPNSVEIDATCACPILPSADLTRKMRASYYLLGAGLGRFGSAMVGYPGGCDFGKRPIDQHVKGFESLGAIVEESEDGLITATVGEGGLHSGNIFFDVVSVGATLNVMMAAVTAPGQTIIENAAREPHIVDLANFLNTCGAQITGAGTDTIKIKGVSELHGCSYAIIPDMIEAGTYMAAVAATSGQVKINNVIPKHLESITAKLEEMGVSVEELDDAVVVTRTEPLQKCNIKTLPYPGFPTDMQPQFCALFCLAEGTCHLTEGVWDNRFRYVDELRRLGAQIEVNGKTASVTGGAPLHGTSVRAVDLRGGAAMVIAGLCADGQTVIDDIHLIERGYHDLVGKLTAVGADICRVVYPDPIVQLS